MVKYHADNIDKFCESQNTIASDGFRENRQTFAQLAGVRSGDPKPMKLEAVED